MKAPAPTHTELDTRRIRAISLDLDDTLWPIWPTIARAEAALHKWMLSHAPASAALCKNPSTMHEVRMNMHRTRPDLANDMSALRLEAIRSVLKTAGDNPALAEQGFGVFFAERQRVTLYADALPALESLSARFPLVAVSNGNADLAQMGLDHFFTASFSARGFGVGKPDSKIFHAAARSVGVTASDVLHVGDDAHLDVVGALDAGMQTAWLNRDHKLWAHAPRVPHITVRDLSTLCRALG